MKKVTGFLISIFLFFMAAGISQAGTIYTDQAAFDAAVTNLFLAGTEDFEGFPSGPVTDPFLIVGGNAEIVNFYTGEILDGGSTSSFWIGFVENSLLAIQGNGDSSLNLSAVSFNFGNEINQFINFHHTSGLDTSSLYPSTNPEAVNFIGWLGTSAETLNLIQFGKPEGIILDNLRGYTSPIPEPTTMLLFGVGLLGLAGMSRKETIKC